MTSVPVRLNLSIIVATRPICSVWLHVPEFRQPLSDACAPHEISFPEKEHFRFRPAPPRALNVGHSVGWKIIRSNPRGRPSSEQSWQGMSASTLLWICESCIRTGADGGVQTK